MINIRQKNKKTLIGGLTRGLALWGLVGWVSLAPAQNNFQYETFSLYTLESLKPIQVIVPKTSPPDRFYVRVRFNAQLKGAVIRMDQQDVTAAIGDIKTTSIPAALAAPYLDQFTNTVSFPISAIQGAKDSLELAFELGNGQTKSYKLSHRRLQKLKSKMKPAFPAPL